MAIYDFFLSRNNAASTPQNYVGHAGRLFFNSATGEIRFSNGSTPGGLPVPITLATTATAGSMKPGLGLKVDADGVISIDATSSFAFAGNKLSLLAATDTRLGGVKLGPGVTTNAEGQIVIDSSGLDFSFGDFSAIVETYAVGHPKAGDDYAILQTTHVDEDAYFASNGTGSINVVGEFNVYRPDGDVAGAIEIPPIFTVKNDGQIQMLVPGADSTEGALNIVGGLDGVFQPPVNTGVMLHITGIAGTPGVPSRVYNDAQNAFAAFVARRYNGTAASPTAVLANEEIMRLSGTAHNGTTIPGTGNQRIVFTALGNQTLTNQGGAIELWATPINTTTLGKVATVDSTGITLESGKVLTGNVTGTAATATNLAAATNILAGTITIDPASVAGASDSTQTFTLTGLTTNHKIVITSGTAFTGGLIITGAWASALNTVSISFRNTSNQAVDAGAHTIQYFAWV